MWVGGEATLNRVPEYTQTAYRRNATPQRVPLPVC